MKVIFVVDSLTDIKNRLELFSGFGNNVLYVVKSPFEEIVKTYGITPNAVYSNNLAKVIHLLLARADIEATLIYYSSLHITADFLAEFLLKIGEGDKVVQVVPNYNAGERAFNVLYNTYVKTIFKLKDSLVSPKLQFLPMGFVAELMHTHIANRLFEVNPKRITNVSTEDKEINKSLKVKPKFNKFYLIPIMVMLALTALLITCLAFFKPTFILIFTFIALYILDIVLACGYRYKVQFDERFFK